jgi:serine/threonine protein kinase
MASISHIAARRRVAPRAKKEHCPALDEFVFLGQIGRGAFGRVYKVARKSSPDCVFALKTIRKDAVVEGNLVEHTLLEKDIMALYGNHPFIINLHCAFQSDESLFLVMDYLPTGSMHSFLAAHPPPGFSEDLVRFYAAQILLALQYLHDNDVAYRYVYQTCLHATNRPSPSPSPSLQLTVARVTIAIVI